MTINLDQKIDNIPFVANWLAQQAGKKPQMVYEYPLYTDARILGEVKGQCGPYSFLNLVSDHPDQRVRAGFIVRIAVTDIGDGDLRNRLKTDTARFHGGSLVDEISALSSLVLGVRVEAGDCSREFNLKSNDPFGRPQGWGRRVPPVLNIAANQPIIPSARTQTNLGDLLVLNSVTRLNQQQAVALIRAARLFKDALWIGESEPELAWLMLVSALESGAQCWSKGDYEPWQKMVKSKRDLSKFLLCSGGRTMLRKVSSFLGDSIGATKKFSTFCLHFLPSAPDHRPVEDWLRIDWSQKNWKKIFNKVYGYRSKALHVGIPFPIPMCEPPYIASSNGIPTERGLVALAMHGHGGTWAADDVPINLNLFVQVTRNILINWLREMSGSEEVEEVEPLQ